MDDVVYPIMHREPKIVFDTLPLLGAVVVDTFAIHVLRLNFKTGKTNCCAVFRGTLSKSVDHALFGHDVPCVVVKSKAMGCVKIPAVRQYLHLGSTFNPKVGVMPAVCHIIVKTSKVP